MSYLCQKCRENAVASNVGVWIYCQGIFVLKLWQGSGICWLKVTTQQLVLEQSTNCQEITWLLKMCCNITSKIHRTTISATNRPRVKFKQRGSLYKPYIIRNDKDQNKKYFTKQSFNLRSKAGARRQNFYCLCLLSLSIS